MQEMDHFRIIFDTGSITHPIHPKSHPRLYLTSSQESSNHLPICQVRLAPLELPTFPGVPQAAAVSPLPLPGFALSAGLQAPVELKAVAEAQAAAELLKEMGDGMGIWVGKYLLELYPQ